MKTAGRQVLSAWALFAALALLMLGNGLGGSLVGLRARLEGFTTLTTGLVMAGYYVGFLGGSTMTPRILSGVGHVRVYSGLASLASVATLGHLIFGEPFAWFGMRVITGFSLAGLYVVAESWLNGISNNLKDGCSRSTWWSSPVASAPANCCSEPPTRPVSPYSWWLRS